MVGLVSRSIGFWGTLCRTAFSGAIRNLPHFTDRRVFCALLIRKSGVFTDGSVLVICGSSVKVYLCVRESIWVIDPSVNYALLRTVCTMFVVDV